MLRAGEWAVLEAHWPGNQPQRIGLLLHDQTGNILRAKIRDDWSIADRDGELWRDLNADVERMASELGAQQTVEWLGNASHTIRLGSRKAVTFSDVDAALETLYIQHVIEGSAIEPEQAKDTAISQNRTWQRALGTSGSFLALAANIALVAVRSVSHHPSQPPPMAVEMVQKGSAYDNPLPPLLSEALPTRLLDLTLSTNLASSGHRATAVQRYPRHRNFHSNTRLAATVRPHILRAALPSPPALPLATPTPPSEVALSLPTPPDFRPRHRFLHALIAPFRTVALAFVDHENNSGSKSQQD
jgi:hypothetical protein